MKSFYTQQVLGTLAIAGLWIVAIFTLTGRPETTPSHLRLAPKTLEEQLAKVVHEPRNPQTGETDRFHHMDAYGIERKTEVNFVDKTKAVIEYSVFGKPFRISETKKDGSTQNFLLDPMGQQLLKVESKRPDGSLKSSTRPVDQGTLERLFYSEDGKVLACRQLIKADGSLKSEIYAEDGKTVKAVYEQTAAAAPSSPDGGWQPPQPTTSTLKVFDANGKVVREEVITRSNDDECGGECGGEYFQETVSVKIFWENGKAKYEQEWQAYPGDSSGGTLQSASEFDRDGKKLRTLVSCYEKAGKEQASQRLDRFDREGKAVVSSQFLNSSRKLVMEKKKVEGKPETTNVISDGQVIESPLMDPPSYKTLPQDFLNTQLEPNRLQQVLSK